MAVLVPCAALVAFGLRLARQEQELARARLGDERRRVSRQLRQALTARLEATALRQAGLAAARPEHLAAAGYADTMVALAARISDGRLVLPWEQSLRAGATTGARDEEAFAVRMRRAERAEFRRQDPAGAARLYRAAMEAAAGPLQKTRVRLSLARALAGAGRSDRAVATYREVARAPPGVMDRHGVPLSLYAAARLVEMGRADADLLECLRSALPRDSWLSPPALYVLRSVVADFLAHAPDSGLRRAARHVEDEAGERLARMEQVLALKQDLPALGLIPAEAAAASPGPRWVVYGTPAWLVGTTPIAGGEDALLVAVRARPVLASLRPPPGPSRQFEAEVVPAASGAAGVTGTASGAAGATPLGPRFPGLSVRFVPSGAAAVVVGPARRRFYLAGLVLVLGVTLFGAYLLWRDTRREVALAETRSRFVAAVSHELKTPLTAIRMFADTLRMGRPTDPKTRDEYLETIANESRRLTRLLNNVLEFSQVERGKKVYQLEPRPLPEIVRSSVRAMEYPLEQARFQLEVEIEDDLPRARVDRDAVEQAILNLLSNAMKYSGEKRWIGLRLRRKGEEAVIEVSDHGVGIDAEEQARIFDRFHRVTSSGGDGIPGAGLGLSVVKHVADAHGGRILVESAPGEGSTFRLYLPLPGGVE